MLGLSLQCFYPLVIEGQKCFGVFLSNPYLLSCSQISLRVNVFNSLKEASVIWQIIYLTRSSRQWKPWEWSVNVLEEERWSTTAKRKQLECSENQL